MKLNQENHIFSFEKHVHVFQNATLRLLARFDETLDLRANLGLNLGEGVGGLEVEPEFRGCAEVLGQPQGGVRRE